MIQRYSYYVGQDMVEDNDEGPYVTYDDYTTDIAEKEAALNAEKQKVRELVEALEWYVMEDDVIEGMEGNEFWVEGKRKAQALIEKYKDEPNA